MYSPIGQFPQKLNSISLFFNLRGLFQVPHLQLISPFAPYSLPYSALNQDQTICQHFCFLLFSFHDSLEQENQLAGLPLITKTIQVRRTRHAGHCWRSKDELISDVLLWTPTHGCARVGRPARTYIQQLCEDTGCNPEDLPEAMNDREKWRETVRDIRAGGATWWWWWLLIKLTIIIIVIYNKHLSLYLLLNTWYHD